MNLAAFARRYLAMLAVGAGVGWVAAPLPPELPASVQARRDPWSLADLPRRPDLARATVEVATADLWGQPKKATGKAAEAAAPEDPRWRVAGTYGHGAERHVIIAFFAPTKRPQYLRVGETLPSGHKIVSINDNEVCLQIGKQKRRLAVERLDP